MVFNSVAELFDSIGRTRASLYEQVEGLSQEQSSFRPADDAWSVAEIAEHLGLLESRLAPLVKGLVEQGEASAALIDADGTIAPISIEHITARTAGKSKAPEFLQPTGQVSLEEAIEKLRQTREVLLALKNNLQARDFTPVTYTNERLGALNPYQWLAFIGYHEDRHLNQISALISSESFPARQAASA